MTERHQRIGIPLRLLAIVIVIAVILTAFYVWLPATFSDEVPLSISEDSMSFGDVWVRDKFIWPVEIINSGADEVQIAEFRASCSCTSIRPATLVLPPFSKRTIEMIINLTTSDPKKIRVKRRPVSIDVVAELVKPLKGVYSWEVAGYSKSSFAVVPPLVNLGDVPTGKTLALDGPSIELLESETQASNIQLQIRPNVGTMSMRSSSKLAGRLETTLLCEEMEAVGPFTWYLTVSRTSSNGQRLDSIQVPLVGRIVSDIEVIPGAVQLGLVQIRDAKEGTVAIRSRSGRPISISEPGSLNENMAYSQMNSEGEIRMKIRVNCTSKGHNSITLNLPIKYEEPGSQPVSVEIPIHWYGTDSE